MVSCFICWIKLIHYFIYTDYKEWSLITLMSIHHSPDPLAWTRFKNNSRLLWFFISVIFQLPLKCCNQVLPSIQGLGQCSDWAVGRRRKLSFGQQNIERLKNGAPFVVQANKSKIIFNWFLFCSDVDFFCFFLYPTFVFNLSSIITQAVYCIT